MIQIVCLLTKCTTKENRIRTKSPLMSVVCTSLVFKILGTSVEVWYSNWSFCKGLISACTSTDLDYYKTKIQSFFTKRVSPIKEQKDPGHQKVLNSYICKVIQTLKQDNLYLMVLLILVIIFLGYIPFLEGRACNHACPDLDSRRLAEIITNIVIPVGHFLNKYSKISFYGGDKSHQRV